MDAALIPTDFQVESMRKLRRALSKATSEGYDACEHLKDEDILAVTGNWRGYLVKCLEDLPSSFLRKQLLEFVANRTAVTIRECIEDRMDSIQPNRIEAMSF